MRPGQKITLPRLTYTGDNGAEIAIDPGEYEVVAVAQGGWKGSQEEPGATYHLKNVETGAEHCIRGETLEEWKQKELVPHDL